MEIVIQAQHVGPVEAIEIVLARPGLTLVEGPNEAGKSSLERGLFALTEAGAARPAVMVGAERGSVALEADGVRRELTVLPSRVTRSGTMPVKVLPGAAALKIADGAGLADPKRADAARLSALAEVAGLRCSAADLGAGSRLLKPLDEAAEEARRAAQEAARTREADAAATARELSRAREQWQALPAVECAVSVADAAAGLTTAQRKRAAVEHGWHVRARAETQREAMRAAVPPEEDTAALVAAQEQAKTVWEQRAAIEAEAVAEVVRLEAELRKAELACTRAQEACTRAQSDTDRAQDCAQAAQQATQAAAARAVRRAALLEQIEAPIEGPTDADLAAAATAEDAAAALVEVARTAAERTGLAERIVVLTTDAARDSADAKAARALATTGIAAAVQLRLREARVPGLSVTDEGVLQAADGQGRLWPLSQLSEGARLTVALQALVATASGEPTLLVLPQERMDGLDEAHRERLSQACAEMGVHAIGFAVGPGEGLSVRYVNHEMEVRHE